MNFLIFQPNKYGIYGNYIKESRTCGLLVHSFSKSENAIVCSGGGWIAVYVLYWTARVFFVSVMYLSSLCTWLLTLISFTAPVSALTRDGQHSTKVHSSYLLRFRLHVDGSQFTKANTFHIDVYYFILYYKI